MTLLTTGLCRLLGIDHPIIQAPVGSATTPELVAAVSGAGGMGILALTWLDQAASEERIARTRALTLALYAGQSAGLVHETLPAAEVVRRMVQEAESALVPHRARGES